MIIIPKHELYIMVITPKIIRLKYPCRSCFLSFYVIYPILRGLQMSEDTADTLSVYTVHIVWKTPNYAIDVFRTKYMTILCESTQKLAKIL